jgi:hypothetical protein
VVQPIRHRAVVDPKLSTDPAERPTGRLELGGPGHIHDQCPKIPAKAATSSTATQARGHHGQITSQAVTRSKSSRSNVSHQASMTTTNDLQTPWSSAREAVVRESCLRATLSITRSSPTTSGKTSKQLGPQIHACPRLSITRTTARCDALASITLLKSARREAEELRKWSGLARWNRALVFQLNGEVERRRDPDVGSLVLGCRTFEDDRANRKLVGGLKSKCKRKVKRVLGTRRTSESHLRLKLLYEGLESWLQIICHRRTLSIPTSSTDSARGRIPPR